MLQTVFNRRLLAFLAGRSCVTEKLILNTKKVDCRPCHSGLPASRELRRWERAWSASVMWTRTSLAVETQDAGFARGVLCTRSLGNVVSTNSI